MADEMGAHAAQEEAAKRVKRIDHYDVSEFEGGFVNFYSYCRPGKVS